MERRTFLTGLTGISLLAAPKTEVEQVDASRGYLYIAMLTRMIAQTIRMEGSPAQWAAYSDLRLHYKLNAQQEPDTELALSVPFAINPSMPQDEIRLVAHDGTVMARIRGLAIPVGF